jgi:EAL domain-containing protein (putative c-di-GMP-specific phosphodiesterase class I)/ActR/RegA family two-component response regulator
MGQMKRQGSVVSVGEAGRRTAILVVDDEPSILGVLERVLEKSFDVVSCASGAEAVVQVQQGGFAAVISDVNMPGMTGLELLRAIREYDADLPVLLVTGQPSWQGAAEAIEYGVFRYLSKPFELNGLRDIVIQATQLYRLARLKREALSIGGVPGPSDRAGLEASFARALASIGMAFQPIVSLSAKSILGYEALLRSAEPTLPNPTDMIDAAERLGATRKLGRAVRAFAAQRRNLMNQEWLLFVNLHPYDLLDPELTDPDSPLMVMADRVVLEITERTPLSSLEEVRDRVVELRQLGFRIAVDDLGAGYAGLTSFAILDPDIVKLDMNLVRGIESSAVKRRLVGSVTSLCREMDMLLVAEGVETAAERDVLSELGCDLFQGFLFARPASAFYQPAF